MTAPAESLACIPLPDATLLVLSPREADAIRAEHAARVERERQRAAERQRRRVRL